MRCMLSLAAFAAIAMTGSLAENNIPGAVYKATLPASPFFTEAALSKDLYGSLTGVSSVHGESVVFTVKFEGLPVQGGPFTYHIHETKAINGNCTSTLDHLDPFNVGTDTPCDATNPASCQAGDLSGKHGSVTSDPFMARYADAYVSTDPASDAFFGDKSFVLHYANGTRLACANFERIVTPKPVPDPTDNCTMPSTTGAGWPTGSGGSVPTQPPFSGAAAAVTSSASVLGAFVSAVVAYLLVSGS